MAVFPSIEQWEQPGSQRTVPFGSGEERSSCLISVLLFYFKFQSLRHLKNIHHALYLIWVLSSIFNCTSHIGMFLKDTKFAQDPKELTGHLNLRWIAVGQLWWGQETLQRSMLLPMRIALKKVLRFAQVTHFIFFKPFSACLLSESLQWSSNLVTPNPLQTCRTHSSVADSFLLSALIPSSSSAQSIPFSGALSSL